VGWLMIITAGLTAYYTFRMFFLCFYGQERWPKEAGEHPHEMSGMMTNPLWVLALGAVFAGYLGVTIAPSTSNSFLGFLNPHGFFHDVLAGSTIVSGPHHPGHIWIAYVSSVVALAGIGLAYARYGAAPQEDPDAKLLGPVFTLLNHKYWVDELYAAIFVQPLRKLGDFFFGTDRFGINGIIKAVTIVARSLSFLLSLFQRGAVAGYALTMVLGTALLLVVWRWSV